MDALRLLAQDHQKVKKILGELEKTTERAAKKREELFGQLMQELTVHEKIEEAIFYPAVKERAETKKIEELINESYEEHHIVDVVAAEIKGTPFEDEQWHARFKVLKENIDHHAFEEEEGKLFPKVRRAFSEDELEDLGARMMEMKEAELSGVGQEQDAAR